MKSLIFALSLAVASAGLAPVAAEAKRLGGGSSLGIQRSLPRTPPPAAPARPAQAAPNPAPGALPGAAAAAPRRSWLGPIAGLAAGLGIAALMSHLGLGAAMGEFVMLLLLAIVAFVVIRFLLRRFGPAAGRPMATPNGAAFANNAGFDRSAYAPAPNAAPPASFTTAEAAPRLPPGFDAVGFERVAKSIFVRLQAANDRGDLNELRSFTAPELYLAIEQDLRGRGNAPQHTEVVQLEAQVLELATEGDRQYVSVRFHGLIREQAAGPVEPFDEVWNLVRPADGKSDWAIGGIQQRLPASV